MCPGGVTGKLCDECVSPYQHFHRAYRGCVGAPGLSSSPTCDPARAESFGGGHFRTFDGRTFDVSGVCEYTLLHTFCEARPEVTIQARMRRVAGADGQPADSGLSAISRLAVRMTPADGAVPGDVVELLPDASGEGVTVLVNGGAVYTLGRAAAFGQGFVYGAADSQNMLLKFNASGLAVRVGRSWTSPSLEIFVDVVDPVDTCGCSEGLLGFHDGQDSTDFLTPQFTYRGNSSLPVGFEEFAWGSYPQSVGPVMNDFGEAWRLSSQDVPRLFTDDLSEQCDSSGGPVSPSRASTFCLQSGAAVQCCASLANTAKYTSCLADFCSSGSCWIPSSTLLGECSDAAQSCGSAADVVCIDGQCTGNVM